MFLVDKKIPSSHPKSSSSEGEKISYVRDKYLKSADFTSPSFDESKIDADLHGRIRGDVMSYQMMDNPKYKEIETLLDIMVDSHDKDSSFEKKTTSGASWINSN